MHISDDRGFVTAGHAGTRRTEIYVTKTQSSGVNDRTEPGPDGLAKTAQSARARYVLQAPGLSRIQPTEAQASAFRKMAQVSDPLADNLLVAMHRLPKGDGRRQFDQAVDHGIESVADPLPELVEFMEAVDNVPYWVDFRKIGTAQRLFARIPMRSITMMTIPGFILTYGATRPNQVLVRTGGLEEGATGRIAETIAWLVACTQLGGMDRFGEGLRSCARVRLVHAYVRSAMNGLDDWDYDNWDYPVNQAQQALTLLPFLLLSPSLLALGHLHTPAESSAINHLLRYMSHVVGVRPELQISNIREMLRLTWLALWTEMKADEYSPRLAKAALEASYAMYDLPTRGFLAGPARWATYRLHADLAVLTSLLVSRKAMGLPRLSPMVMALPVIFGVNLTSEIVRMAVPGASRLRTARGTRLRKIVMEKIVERSKADLTFDKSATSENVERKRKAANRLKLAPATT